MKKMKKSFFENVTDGLTVGVEVTQSVSSISTSLGIAKQTLGVVDAVGEAIKPFVPLIGIVTVLVGEIIQVYENAQYNKKICIAFIDRVEAAKLSVIALQRRKEEHLETFQDEIYYKNFVRFTEVLRKVKEFLKKVSQLHGFKRFFNANNVKEKFELLTKEFDDVMNDLHFTITVSVQRQNEIDQRDLKEDLTKMTKFLDNIHGGIVDKNQQLNAAVQEVLILKGQMESIDNNKKAPPNGNLIKADEIPQNELEDPLHSKKTDCRGKPSHIHIFKKFWKKAAIDVACKIVQIPNEKENSQEYQKVQALFTILGKLRDSHNIIKFYGLSNIDGTQMMVLEWAELGSLKEVYEKYDIGWRAKVEIALDICRGLTFLHSCLILHHDIRCDNILMDKNCKSKIAKFDYARYTHGETSDVKNMTEVVHWLAPEKLRFGPKQCYNFKCEIFSFGMLLWELAFEIKPYREWGIEKIKEYVLTGGRENIQFGEADDETKNLQQDYAKIIRGAWQDDPSLRSSLQNVFFQLDGLYSQYPPLVAEPRLCKSKTIDFDGSLRGGKRPISVSDKDSKSQFKEPPQGVVITEIITLEKGILAHTNKDYKTAWTCFQAHADLDNSSAKYWKGYYLWEGYCGYQNRTLATKLFKEAADEGVPDAQLRYAFSLLENKNKFNKEEFIQYLKLAADDSNFNAQFNLGDTYFHGKLGVEQDKEQGINYLKLAALNNHPKANEMLKGMNINIYN